MIRPDLKAATFLLLLLLAPAASPADGDGAQPPGPRKDVVLAQEFLAAYRAGDEAAMEELAGRSRVHAHLDPFVVAHDLLSIHAEGMLADPPRRGDALDAARALAVRVQDGPLNGPLLGLVEGWDRLDVEALRREVRLRAGYDSIETAILSGMGEECAVAMDGYRKAAAEAAPGLGAARLQAGVANWLTTTGRTREAAEAWREAAILAERVPWPAGRCNYLWCAGFQAYRCGELGEARALWEERVSVHEALGDRSGQTWALFSVAEVHEALGEYGVAHDLAERALPVAEESGDPYTAATAHLVLANIQSLRGDYAGALSRLETALRRYREEASSELGEARCFACFGRTFARLGLDDRAVENLERSIAGIDALRGLPFEAAAYRLELAGILAREGSLDRAAEILERARRDLEAAGDRVGAAEAQARRGDLLSRQGLHERAVAELESALAGMVAMGNRPSAARARAGLARVHAARGEPRLARELGETALEEAEGIGDRDGAARVRIDLAALHRDLGRPAEAMRLARRAVETPLALGTGLGETEGAGLRRGARAAADQGILAALELAADGGPEGAAAAGEAYWFAESSRGLLLADGIGNRDALLEAAVPPALRAADAAARERVAGLRANLADLAARAGVERGTLAAARADLDAAYRGLEETAGRVQREARRVADLVYPRPMALADLQGSLDPASVLVLYHLTPGRALAVAVTRESVRLADLGDAEVLAESVRRYLDLVSVEGSREEPRAAALYEALLRPLEPETDRRTRLLLSPDGALAFLPFEALLRAGEDRDERVLERWEVSYVPSATVHSILAAERTGAPAPGRGVLAVGDPVYPGEPAAGGADFRGYGRLRRLPGTAAEARAVVDLVPPEERVLLLRGDATVAALRGALARAPRRLAALHVACHGRLDAEHPRLTGLVLSGGEVLSLDDVHRMRVPADLVVLSACETGRGRLLHGEGALGLARGFLFAGASRVVVSDWAVTDEAARTLMTSFYGRMLREGMSASAALRAAKLEMLRAGGPPSHPAHWAAFVLWGGG